MNLSQHEADRIARKLNAERKEGRGHEKVYVKTDQGVLIGRYGIQRASKQLPHDYIAKQIHVSMREAIDLARCPMSNERYFELMAERGKI